ncbi:hypothetical protein G6O69_23040 [Pseudenhygromyxa sp. WMMC2535]|uniref:hypothetical protein n=1 Tax=Pseudenhygromyxa sp. WMMC2535 TaxID=2712867 RepID=UPI00155829B5|nr:hypothetical protein [Pseudenhygromyxa sp. WMMC2535]NVB40734.1 hypothetical protein [Pseudenhygromyxa sp. WMMC2535]
MLERAEIAPLLQPGVDPARLHAFSLQWSALSLKLLEESERFLLEGSYRCQAVREYQLGRDMLTLARGSIPRYRRLADHARDLVEQWNERRSVQIGHTQLLTQQTPPSLLRLLQRRRSLLESDAPWTFLAAIHEVDALLTLLGPLLLQRAEEAQLQPGVRLYTDVVAMSEARTAEILDSFLRASPHRVDTLLAAGEDVLNNYADFLAECAIAALNLATARSHHGSSAGYK